MAADPAEVMRLAKEMVVFKIAVAADAYGLKKSELRDEVLYEIVHRRMEEKSSESYIRSFDACRILGMDHRTLQQKKTVSLDT